MTPAEWPWLLSRSMATGWAQLSPIQQKETPPETLMAQVTRVLEYALSQPGGAALVAREQGAPVGFLVVTVIPDELTGMPTGFFVDIWVDPQWRGTGVSQQLTAAGEDHLRALGLRTVRRAISAHNMPSLFHAFKDGCQVERYMLVKEL